MAISLTSPAFEAGGRIPEKHTGEGQDVSPALRWSGLPAETASIALICDDPDAPRAEPWVHWVIFNLRPSTTELPEGVKAVPEPTIGVVQGLTDFGRVGYGGPMPPKGHGTHRYHFRIYALDTMLVIPGTPTKKTVLEAMRGHVLAEGELVGTYSR